MRDFTGPILVLALLVLAQPLHAQPKKEVTNKEAETALEEFNKFFGNANEHVRKAAVDQLGDCNHAKSVMPLLSAWDDKSEIVKKSVSPALAKQSTPEALATLTRELKKTSDLGKKLAILEAFKVTRPKVAYDTIFKLSDDKVYELRLVATEILALMPPEDDRAQKRLIDLLQDKEPQIRLVAIDALVALQIKEAIDLCLDLARNDPDWRVQATAIAALAGLRDKKSVAPLIDMLENGEGRLREDAHKALVSLTGRSYAPDPKTWKDWWARVGSKFEIPTQAQLEEQRQKLKEAMAAYGGSPDDTPPFLGIRTKSQRILFILDVSGSMADKITMTGASPEKIEEFKKRYGEEAETKIDFCREELITTIANLGDHVRFNICLFDADVRPWKKSLQKATPGNKNVAIKFLSRLTTDEIKRRLIKDEKGGTNTFGALNFAFGLANEEQEIPSKNHTVDSDTVFFFTDGMPTYGRITDISELLRYFKVLNSRTKMVFHTLTFGTGNASLLKPMADLSGGQYVAVSFD
ncbi:MAG: hypothetical protein H6807_17320 [Planctomycetes bacterium]|nr:hypothetical protein [Planctomycetota bacterium]